MADATEEVFSLPSLQTAPPTRGDVLRSALERALAEVEATEHANEDDVTPVAHHRAISTALTALREAPRDALAQATALALLNRVIMPPERADARRRARADACAVYALDAGAAPLVQHALASAAGRAQLVAGQAHATASRLVAIAEAQAGAPALPSDAVDAALDAPSADHAFAMGVLEGVGDDDARARAALSQSLALRAAAFRPYSISVENRRQLHALFGGGGAHQLSSSFQARARAAVPGAT